MLFDDRLNAAHKELESTGIWKSNFNPPITRILRKAGLKIRPPHYYSFLVIFLIYAVYFGCAWGLTMWFIMWSSQSMTPEIALITSLFSGIFVGLSMALYYRITAKKNNLSSWEKLVP